MPTCFVCSDLVDRDEYLNDDLDAEETFPLFVVLGVKEAGLL